MKVLSGGVGSPAKGAASSDEAPAGPKRGHSATHSVASRHAQTRPSGAAWPRSHSWTRASLRSRTSLWASRWREAPSRRPGGFTFAYAGWLVLSAMHRSLITDPMAIEGDIRNSKTTRV